MKMWYVIGRVFILIDVGRWIFHVKSLKGKQTEFDGLNMSL